MSSYHFIDYDPVSPHELPCLSLLHIMVQSRGLGRWLGGHRSTSVAAPTWMRRAKRYIEGLKNSEKIMTNLKKNVDIKSDI